VSNNIHVITVKYFHYIKGEPLPPLISRWTSSDEKRLTMMMMMMMCNDLMSLNVHLKAD